MTTLCIFHNICFKEHLFLHCTGLLQSSEKMLLFDTRKYECLTTITNQFSYPLVTETDIGIRQKKSFQIKIEEYFKCISFVHCHVYSPTWGLMQSFRTLGQFSKLPPTQRLHCICFWLNPNILFTYDPM